jgi:terminase family protein
MADEDKVIDVQSERVGEKQPRPVPRHGKVEKRGRPRGTTKKSPKDALGQALQIASSMTQQTTAVSKTTAAPVMPSPIASGQGVVIAPIPKYQKDIASDYDYSRANFYNLIEKGNTAIDGILELAAEGEHPRAYEVAATLIKTVSEVTKELLNLQKQMKELSEERKNEAKTQTVNGDVSTQNVFVGGMSDVLKIIKDAQNKK